MGREAGGVQQGVILNRFITLTPDGALWEADIRHVELLTAEVGLTGATGRASPGLKLKREELEEQKHCPHLRRALTGALQRGLGTWRRTAGMLCSQRRNA